MAELPEMDQAGELGVESVTPSPPPIATAATDLAVRELRLALVCYGGVSLAIYMHGITKELQSLVVASRAFDRAVMAGSTGENPFPPLRTEHAYFRQLVQLYDAGAPATAVIDVIAGTSAGGINGVCLAKALAQNRPQDGLTQLWLDRGDINGLLPRHLFGYLGGLARIVAQLPRKALTAWAPLNGDKMCRWIADALRDMDGAHPVSDYSLVPDAHDLDLFVTATDLRGYQRIVPTGAGGGSQHDRIYRKVFHFRHGGGDSQFGPALNGGLTFAARCTSSFPGAFAPMSLTELDRILTGGPDRFDVEAFARYFLPEYRWSDDARHTYFVDGGVLDNAPFDHAVGAIAGKSAEAEVVRHLVYIEPDPSPWPAAGTATKPTLDHADKATPSWAKTLWAALASIPGHQPLVNDLLAIQNLNQQVATVGEITTALEQDVQTELAAVYGQGERWSFSSYEEVQRAAAAVYQRVPQVVGQPAWRTYCRLKMEEIGRRLAVDIAKTLAYPPDSSQASFLRAAIAHWLREQPAWNPTRADDLPKFLGPLDAPYRERRLQFILAGVNDLYGRSTHGETTLPRTEIAAVKEAVWRALADLLAAPGKALKMLSDTEVARFVGKDALDPGTVLGEPRTFAKHHRDEIRRLVDGYAVELEKISPQSSAWMWTQFQERTRSWGPEHADERVALASRYVGFPLWDPYVFPVIALSRLPQFTPIAVSRFSPHDAKLLTPPKGEDGKPAMKLKGIPVHHFAAFFAREHRENDYLWGRLDGVELIVNLLRGTYPGDRAALPSPDPLLHDGFAAVIGQETKQGQLTKVGELIAELRGQIGPVDLQEPAVSGSRAEDSPSGRGQVAGTGGDDRA